MLKKKCCKIILGKSFDKKKIGKINYKRKIFITKFIATLISATLFSSCQHPSTEQGEKQGVMKTSIAYDSKQAVITACELSVTRLPHERYLLHRWYEKFQFGLAPTIKRRSTECHKTVEWCASAVVPEISTNLWSYGVNHSISMVLIHRL